VDCQQGLSNSVQGCPLGGILEMKETDMLQSPSAYLIALGRQVLGRYAKLPGCVCAAITGSAAEGLADEYSDLDTTVYYSTLPPEAEIRAIREQVGGGPYTWNAGTHAEGEFGEGFRIRGVDCQIGHTTVARWEEDLGRVLRAEEIASPLHKAMSGTLVSIAVHGAEVLEGWKARIRDYPDTLARAMVKHHLSFFPVWGVIDRLERRDADLWLKQIMVEASFNLLGVLAGLNRKYFTKFQYKRSGAFVRSLIIAPERFEARLESLILLPAREAAAELKKLVSEVVVLVERHMPEVDGALVRKGLGRQDEPWVRCG